MLRRLRVRGYKSLIDCEVRLRPLTVVIGPNGAGKSNLLDLVGLLSRLASRETVRDAFEGHRGRPLEAFHSPDGFGAAAYERLLARERLSFDVECELEIHPGIVQDVNAALEERETATGARSPYTRVTERMLRYSLRIEIHPRTGQLFVADERLEALRPDGAPRATRRPFIERTAAAGAGDDRFLARIERQSHPRYFPVDRQRTLLSELSDPVYHPHVVAAAREIASWRVYYVEPVRMRTEIGVQSSDDPGREGELLAAFYFGLARTNEATFRSVVRTLREFVPGLADLRVDVRDGLLEIVAVMDGGREFPARLLSEGTLRLLCVCGIAVAPRPAAVVVYEEPENGVNAARLELIADILRQATSVRDGAFQAILTSHSAVLCELLPECVVICRQDAALGTVFEKPSWNPDSLYFHDEVLRALGESTVARRHDRVGRVAED